MNQWTSLLISAMALAGLAVFWRTWLRDHPSWTVFLNRLPWQIGKAFTCGTCFTGWITLDFLILFHPFAIDIPPRAYLPQVVVPILQFLVQWMALMWLALIGRFVYAALEEVVYFFVHKIREGHEHKH